TSIRARDLVLGAMPGDPSHARGVLAEVIARGLGVLASVPRRQPVVGAVTRPSEAEGAFRAGTPEDDNVLSETGYVQSGWTIRADDVNVAESMFRTETRAIATDAEARKKFRCYWSFFSPGIVLTRWAVLRPVKRESERRAREQRPTV